MTAAHMGCVCEECMPHNDPNTIEQAVSEVRVGMVAGFPVMALAPDAATISHLLDVDDEILHQTEALWARPSAPTPPPDSANARQPGGSHYLKHEIQPWDAIVAWDLGFLDGNVVKYIARFREKGGLMDLKKARHYLDKLIEVESTP